MAAALAGLTLDEAQDQKSRLDAYALALSINDILALRKKVWTEFDAEALARRLAA